MEISSRSERNKKYKQDLEKSVSLEKASNIKRIIDSILISSNIHNSDITRNKCREMDTMSHNDRIDFIRINWGQAYLDKLMPHLVLLDKVEKV